jgi:hypothetical protein
MVFYGRLGLVFAFDFFMRRWRRRRVEVAVYDGSCLVIGAQDSKGEAGELCRCR